MSVLYIITLLLVAALVSTQKSNDFMEVALEQGIVRGFRHVGRNHYEFLGIPYATTPMGNRRYQAPLTAPTWDGIRDANTSGVMCPQSLHGAIIGSEDCLVANVFVPNTALGQDIRLPILLYIVGGAFRADHSPTNIDDRIMHLDIIVVTINYRIGVLGFLCLGTENVPGNAGLKDQVAALHWVHRNIASFGGDPDRVTLYGTSAGSASVELLMLSEATSGLFQSVITESGSALSGWPVAYDPIGLAKKGSKLAGYADLDDINALTEFYKTASIEELILVSDELYKHLTDTTPGFTPCIERNVENVAVLVDSPRNRIKSGNYNRVPMLAIYANKEGMNFYDRTSSQDYVEHMVTMFQDFLPPDLEFPNEQVQIEFAEMIRKYYFGEKEISSFTVDNFIDFCTDAYFFYGIRQSALLHSDNGVPVYLMENSFYTNNSLYPGASHGDIAEYLFGMIEPGSLIEEIMLDRISTMWANFVKYGKPIPKEDDQLPVSWLPFTSEGNNYLSYGTDMQIRQAPLQERYEFWDNIYSQFYRDIPYYYSK